METWEVENIIIIPLTWVPASQPGGEWDAGRKEVNNL